MTDTARRTTELLEQTGALKTGHFELSSGLHSDRYCQCAALFEHPAVCGELASMATGLIDGLSERPTVVLAPALGGILWGFELARALGVRSLFAERKPGETFQLRRGFALRPDDRVLFAEDVVTTGKSVLELTPLVEAAGAKAVGFCAVADRSAGKFSPGVPFLALVSLSFQTWKPEDCPLCKAGIPIDKPGSRIVKP